ncbi:MAG: hypothetical protein ACOZBL_01125 [Patescibacteria group bacterium]
MLFRYSKTFAVIAVESLAFHSKFSALAQSQAVMSSLFTIITNAGLFLHSYKIFVFHSQIFFHL